MRETGLENACKVLNVTAEPSSISLNDCKDCQTRNNGSCIDTHDEARQAQIVNINDLDSSRDEDQILDSSIVIQDEKIASEGFGEQNGNPNVQTTKRKNLLGHSLRIITESITEYICSSKNLEPISDTPYNGSYQVWASSKCMCCGRCRTCLMSCADGESDINFLSKELEDVRLNFENEINVLMSLPQDENAEWKDSVCTWFTNHGIEFDKKAITNSDSTELKSMLFRNRSHLMNARAHKIDRLRNQMQINLENPDLLSNSQRTIRMVKSEDQEPLSKKRSDSIDDTLAKKLMEVLSPEPKNEQKKNAEDDDDLCYDSDPEIYNEVSFDRRPIILTSMSSNIEESTESIPQLDERSTWSISLNNDPSFEERAASLNIHNSDMVSTIIEELTNKTETLVWHPSRNDRSKDLSPLCVQAWFEMGSRLQSRVIQPKFMWRNAYEHSNDNKQQKYMAASTATPHDIELLDIVRVLKPDSIDRDEYPFAKLKNSFILHSSAEEQVFLFECTSEQERDRFVHGLKLLVARLASKIIVGDEKVFDEFFTPWGLLSSRLQDKGYNVDYSKHLDNNDPGSGSCMDDYHCDSLDGSSVDLNSSDLINSRTF